MGVQGIEMERRKRVSQGKWVFNMRGEKEVGIYLVEILFFLWQ
jgi:hypothetical protein